MIGLSLKQGIPVNMIVPLTEYITQNYSEDDAKLLRESIENINNQRSGVCSLLNDIDSNCKQTIDTYERYLQMVNFLAERFPFGDHSGPSLLNSFGVKKFIPPCIKILFAWPGCFLVSSKASSYNIHFERANVLFNIAVLYHRLAVETKKLNSDTSLTEACKLLMKGAGIMSYIYEDHEISKIGSRVLDISPNFTQVLSCLMMAQAQACVFEKAVVAKMAPFVVAKLAIGTSDLFKSCHDMCDKFSEVKSAMHASKYPWVVHMLFQYFSFNAAAHFYMAKHQLNQDKYADELNSLRKALSMALEAKKWKAGVVIEIVSNRDNLENIIRTRLSEAEHDNETVYHDFSPNTEPDTIPSLVHVKITPFELKEVDESFSNKFSSLIPVEVRNGTRTIEIGLAEHMDAIELKQKADHDEAIEVLSSMKLPGALQALQDQGISNELWHKISTIQHKGGLDTILSQKNHASNIKLEVEQMITSISNDLNKENDENVDMEKKFGSRWNRRPSHQITSGFQSDLDSVTKFMSVAATADRQVEDNLNQYRVSLNLLELDRTSLEAKLPRVKESKQLNNPVAEKLTILLDQLSSQLAKRADLCETMRKKTQEVNCRSLMLSSYKTKSAASIVLEELSKLQPENDEIQELINNQSNLLSQITIANEEFLASKKLNNAGIERENMLCLLDSATILYGTLESNVAEGLKFYSDLLREKILPLRQRVDDFILARNLEKKMIFDQLTQSLGNYSINSQPNVAMHTAPVQPNMPQTAPQNPMYQSAPQESAQCMYTQHTPMQYNSYSAPPMNPNAFDAPQLPIYASQQPVASMASQPEWPCKTCTFLNASSSSKCGMCGGNRM